MTPLQSDCESRFRFTGAGEIKVAGSRDTDAEETICLLALDIDKLNALREAAIRGATEGLDQLTPQDKAALERLYSERDSEGLFVEFCTPILYFLQSYY